MTLHQEWTDKLSDFLDDELTADERQAVESHLAECAVCMAVLEELKQVVSRARTLDPRPPQADLWPGVAERIDVERPAATVVPFGSAQDGPFGSAQDGPFGSAQDGPFGSAQGGPFGSAQGRPMRTRNGWRVTFTLPQLAAASVLIALMSGALAWSLRSRADMRSADASRTTTAAREAETPRAVSPDPSALEREALAERTAVPVSLADAQYDAAVSDLERALKEGRGKLDSTTITILEHNLQTIDEAIRQAREALAADPANSYLNGHLVEARRRKLDLLRRATALTSETD